MKVKIVYNNQKDKELIELVEFSTPFFIEFIDDRTVDGNKEAKSIKGHFAARKNPFVVVYDDEDKFIKCYYSEVSNACQQFIQNYQ